MQNEKQEIHTVFRRFPFFCLRKNLSLTALADLIRVSLISLRFSLTNNNRPESQALSGRLLFERFSWPTADRVSSIGQRRRFRWYSDLVVKICQRAIRSLLFLNTIVGSTGVALTNQLLILCQFLQKPVSLGGRDVEQLYHIFSGNRTFLPG